ncbi:MAG TPA: DUF4198 domain-containing protein [Thermoanaerobaculia bacterium]|nr:DUF4198 domain-containing protein [Thermoanaerobaculia bacterium]
MLSIQPFRSSVTLAAALGLMALPMAAHDFWIAPSTFRPEPGQKVAVHLRVGDALPGDAVPRMPQRIERFALVSAQVSDISGVEGADPAGFVTVAAPGRAYLVYDSNHASITLDGAKFEQHLAEQGLEKISELRRKSGQTAAAAREIYSRCAKALLAVGNETAGSGYDRQAGLPLELVPEADPYGLLPGGSLPVRLLYHGKPLAGVRFEARQEGGGEPIVGRTDGAGRFVLRLPSVGLWLVKAVHMVTAPEGSGADWESFWASLTFELPAGRP